MFADGLRLRFMLLTFQVQIMKILAVLGLPLAFATGCTSSDPSLLPEVVTYRSPTDAHTAIRPQNPRSVLRGYNRRTVIEPERWRERNAAPSGWRNQSVDPVSSTEPQS